MKTLSRLIALSLSVMASTAAFSQVPTAGGSATKISNVVRALPAKQITPISTGVEKGIPFRKFDENHPVLEQFAKDHPNFADRVFKNREEMRDRGFTVQQAKDRFQQRAERKQAHAAKIQKLRDERAQTLANHPKFAHLMQHHPNIASQHRANMIRAHK